MKHLIQNTYEHARYLATCPCCERTDICSDGCTFIDDDPDDWLYMEYNRNVLLIFEKMDLKP